MLHMGSSFQKGIFGIFWAKMGVSTVPATWLSCFAWPGPEPVPAPVPSHVWWKLLGNPRTTLWHGAFNGKITYNSIISRYIKIYQVCSNQVWWNRRVFMVSTEDFPDMTWCLWLQFMLQYFIAHVSFLGLEGFGVKNAQATSRINITIAYPLVNLSQWKFQDPKMEVLYHIRPYCIGIFPYMGLT